MTFMLQSPSFSHDAMIPTRFSGEGADVSPELKWSDPPPETREFALICEDPDAPSEGGWVHWLIYNIPAAVRGLTGGVAKEGLPARPAGAAQGQNSWGTTGYGGPMPPLGDRAHHYHFRLFALDEPLGLNPAATKAELLAAMESRVVAEAELVGLYERPFRLANATKAAAAPVHSPK